MTKVDHTTMEKKWQKLWQEKAIYNPDLKSSQLPFYNLMMFPYPSAEGLHVGNMYAFTGADVYGRYNRMKGKDVFEPIGLDGFGIHSENYAIKIGRHPKDHAKISEKHFYEQLQMIGNGYAWNYKLETYDPKYYKWTQWLFIQMYKAGLTYKSSALVNWCPSCKTVLADEQVIDGACERCKSQVGKREMSSWFFKITKYADRLLENIDGVENKPGFGPVDKDYDVKRYGLRWPEKIKTAQRNWIGRSLGTQVKFKIDGSTKDFIEVFTTRPDTLLGVTFFAVSPEHPHLSKLTTSKYKKDIQKYIGLAKKKTSQEKVFDKNDKSGVFTGSYVINPVNGEKVPVYAADYVLTQYGTGAVMGVPAHDERDFAFARKHKLPVKQVVDINTETHSVVIKRSVSEGFIDEIKREGWYFTDYEGWGWGIVIPKKTESRYVEIVEKYLIDGPWYVHTDGSLKLVIFKDKVFDRVNESKEAKKYARSINIPEDQIGWDNSNNYMFCHNKPGVLINSGGWNGINVPEDLTKIIEDLEGKGFGKATKTFHLRDWLISRQRYWGPPIPMISCKECGWQTVPETDLPVVLPDIKDFKPIGDGTSPLHNAPDSWKKVACPKCGKEAERELDVSDTFLDSSWYFLGYPNLESSEWTGHISPLNKAITKKWLPVDAYIGGAEHAVLHLLYARFVTMVLKDLGFLTFEEPFPFLYGHGLLIKDGAKMSKSRGNIVNPDDYIAKFGADTLRMYLMFLGPFDQGGDFRDTGIEGMNRFLKKVANLYTKEYPQIKSEKKAEVYVKLHKTIKKVTHDLENFRYNTAIAAIMELVNLICVHGTDNTVKEKLILLLAPFAPYLAEEIWVDNLGNSFSIHQQIWPKYDPKLIVEKTTVVAVQVQGKLRGTLEINVEDMDDKANVISKAKSDERIAKWLKDKVVTKEIYVPGKLLNFVI